MSQIVTLANAASLVLSLSAESRHTRKISPEASALDPR